MCIVLCHYINSFFFFDGTKRSYLLNFLGALLQPPYFVKKLENASVTTGEQHQFKCIVSGVPAPEIKWYVDGDEIHNTE